MWEDPIVEEIRKGRIAHAEAFDFDLEAIFADYKAKEIARGRKVVKLDPKPAVVYPPLKGKPTSPFDVPGIDVDVSIEEILEAIRESRARYETDPSEEADSE